MSTFVKYTAKIYFANVLTRFVGDPILHVAGKVGGVLAKPVNAELAKLEEFKRKQEFDRQQEAALMEWFNRNRKNFYSNPKAEAGKAGAAKRWGKDSSGVAESESSQNLDSKK